MSELDKKVSIRVDEWLINHKDEWFSPQDIFRDYEWHEIETKKAVYNHLWYLTNTKKPPYLKKLNKQYRIVDRDAPIVSWKGAKSKGYFNIKWPFELEKYVKIPHRCVVVVGGVSNQGKTTFAHNIINLNWKEHNIVLFDSENSDVELDERFANYPSSDQWPDDLVRDRTANFSDCIEPDYINIIDYLEVQDQFWLIGRYLREIRDALKDGIAVVLVQKGERAKLPLGKEFSRHLARMVITIDRGKLTVVKGKAKADKTIDPNNMKWSFRLDDNGAYFEDIKRYYGSESDDW